MIRPIVKMLSGSHAYGMATESSDVDHRGIFVADERSIRTPFFHIKEYEVSGEDTKFYELNHFMKLCVECNPNIIELLWTDERHILISSPEYEYLRSERNNLISKKIAFTTSGYAFSQLKRIKNHNRWINNPQPEEPPRQIDYLSLLQWFGSEKTFKIDLQDFRDGYKLVPYTNNIFALIESPGSSTVTENHTLNIGEVREDERKAKPLALVKFNSDTYTEAKNNHTNYWTWKKNRNETRSALEEQFGYDTKHAAHLVRLLRIGAEALRSGTIEVLRSDADELKSIRLGAWTYQQVLDYAERMDKLVREFLYPQSKLRHSVDLEHAARILMKVQDMQWTR